ncbi:hypothetical protein Pst134EA_021159 [Puccinia striiformis f. sp. tritici]|uniref:hypothetical protein n=1 Tax=Puccinia striiformis f. sp. tritici TaxID=168172 RepID=UPI000A1243F8|nr:hypothetical protein Pst134EA_021159 [Puccinia striiformis f. sp. tritici]KAH9457275.1 hypothetical protein Pst134EA_021159 [Puccinia striiformis f. sp. tritici]
MGLPVSKEMWLLAWQPAVEDMLPWRNGNALDFYLEHMAAGIQRLRVRAPRGVCELINGCSSFEHVCKSHATSATFQTKLFWAYAE